FSALPKFAHVESWFCGRKRRGKAALDILVNPCVKSVCSRSVAVGLMTGRSPAGTVGTWGTLFSSVCVSRRSRANKQRERAAVQQGKDEYGTYTILQAHRSTLHVVCTPGSRDNSRLGAGSGHAW